MKNFFYVLLALALISAACSKRIVQSQKISVDSTASTYSGSVFLDTSKFSSYERMFLVPDSGLMYFSHGNDSSAWTDWKMLDVSDASNWPPEMVVEFIKRLPEPGTGQYLPVYYERYTNSKAGVSKTETAVAVTEVKAESKVKEVERKADYSWVVGLVLIIIALVLICLFTPRKK